MVHRVVSADGTPIACWRSGAGPPLVLVHGAAADHARWAPVLPAFEERFTVIAIDRRGRGESGDGAGYAIEREYEDVAAVADWAGPGTCLLGHSYGGVCALEAALVSGSVGRLMVSLMLRTGIPISVWEDEGPEVIETAIALLTKEE